MNRRTFVTSAGAGALVALSSHAFAEATAGSPVASGSNNGMRLRPHHILDIVTDHGGGQPIKPSAYGHSYHVVAAKLVADVDQKIELVLAADAVCEGCRHLRPDGKCDDVLSQLNPSPSKQASNDVLDCRLFDAFGLQPGAVLVLRDFLARVNEQVPGLERMCTHPKEDERARREKLTAGLVKLGIRRPT